MRNQRIIFFTDNAALVDVINKTTSRDPVIMGLVRRLVLACLKFNILFRAAHVPGLENHLPDYRFPHLHGQHQRARTHSRPLSGNVLPETFSWSI